jgi:predicted glycoside hydrolase/deacetylase ChbG (UPF0249 family)
VHKKLVVNADDFGFTRDVNAGIIKGHREGILGATTLMANGVAFDEPSGLRRRRRASTSGATLFL